MFNYIIILGSKIDYVKADNSLDLIRKCNVMFGRAPEYAKKLLFM